MKAIINTRTLLVLPAAFALLTACGGGGEDKSTGTPDNNVNVNSANLEPIADAGSAQNVTVGESVTLDATASTDPDGQIATYLWEKISGPAVTILNASSTVANFTAPNVQGQTVMIFQVTVTDDSGAEDSATTSVTVRPGNKPPSASAGPDQNLAKNQQAQLNGAGSHDPDGSLSAYLWEQIGGVAVTINNANLEQASFTAPDEDTVLSFKLTVTDNEDAQATDTVQYVIGSGNAKPELSKSAVAEYAGITLQSGEYVTVAAEHESSQYQWSISDDFQRFADDTAEVGLVAPQVLAISDYSLSLVSGQGIELRQLTVVPAGSDIVSGQAAAYVTVLAVDVAGNELARAATNANGQYQFAVPTGVHYELVALAEHRTASVLVQLNNASAVLQTELDDPALHQLTDFVVENPGVSAQIYLD